MRSNPPPAPRSCLSEILKSQYPRPFSQPRTSEKSGSSHLTVHKRRESGFAPKKKPIRKEKKSGSSHITLHKRQGLAEILNFRTKSKPSHTLDVSPLLMQGLWVCVCVTLTHKQKTLSHTRIIHTCVGVNSYTNTHAWRRPNKRGSEWPQVRGEGLEFAHVRQQRGFEVEPLRTQEGHERGGALECHRPV